MPENTTDQNTEIPENEAQINSDGLLPTPEGVETGEQNGNREKRYRLERNEARTERDSLAQRVAALQTRELERIAGKSLSAPGDLLTLSGKTLADFLDDSGDIDPELVEEVAAEVLASRPGLRPNAPATDPTQGTGGTPGRPTPTFSDLLK